MTFLLLAISTLVCAICIVCSVQELRRERYYISIPYVYSALLLFFTVLMIRK